MREFFHTSLMLFFGYFYSLPVLAQWYSTTLSQARLRMTVITIDNKAVFAGGERHLTCAFCFNPETDQVDIYNAATNQWTSAKLSKPRYDMATASLGNLALFAGGVQGMGGRMSNTLVDVDIYNSNTNQWTTGKLSEARNSIVASGAGNKILFAGGTTPYPGYLSSMMVDVYNVTTNQWSITQLPSLGGHWFSAASVGNKIVFAGSGHADIYDVTTNTWATNNLPTLSSTNPSVTTVGNKAFFVGGLTVLT